MNLTEARILLSKLSTTQLCDALPSIRILSTTIKPYVDKPVMLGKALTVKATGDLLPVIKSLELATSDHVIVIEAGDDECAIAGEIFTSEAKRKHIAGIVMDGFCRDAASILKIGLPFYAKGTYPKAGSKHKLGEFNIPIQCGGIMIHPNDIVIGDENGIVVLNENELESTLTLAIQISEKEDRALQKISNGTCLSDLFNFKEHYDNLLSGRKSEFKWK